MGYITNKIIKAIAISCFIAAYILIWMVFDIVYSANNKELINAIGSIRMLLHLFVSLPILADLIFETKKEKRKNKEN